MGDRLRDHDFQISYGPADDRLGRFYIPALSCSVRYDRTAGFFSSSALAVAAAGVARLVANGGTMRLLVGAQLSEADVQAIVQGRALHDVVAEQLVAALDQPLELVMHKRLQVLAWLVATGRLEMRVVLPKDQHGHPLAAAQAQDYYHPKTGIFTDCHGDQVAFSGSVNESETGWQHNYEQFMVFRSWDASRPFLAQVAIQFERLWAGQEPDWIAIDVPEAARQHLLKYQPQSAPERDPLEPEDDTGGISEIQAHRAQVLFQFLRDAPYLVHAQGLGTATSAVVPWPHQAHIADRVAATYPERYLLCDEVGLGKTIEAGLVLRQLLLSGLCRRCLILAPKSVCHQWQEELYEKFALDVPFYNGHTFRDLAGNQWSPATANPWDGADALIASSQLAKRAERQPELLSARPWDLVLIDEAHHARRKDFLVDTYRPNRLLTLLLGPEGKPGLKDRTRGLLLMTATPMQVHPVEVWDLLQVLGLGGRWGATDKDYLRFFMELRRPFDEVDWDFILDMLADFIGPHGEFDPAFAAEAQKKLGLVDWHTLRGLLSSHEREARLKELPPAARLLLIEMARRHTPLRRYLFRSTRRLLRKYVQQGILKANVPRREPKPIWITMTDREQKLYERIEEYISQYYQKYEAERKGLGFIMTVYRRRLTSSFYAVRRSLERRLEGVLAMLDDDDLEQEDLSTDVGELLDTEQQRRFQDEIAYIKSFIAEIKQFGDHDSKIERLLADLDDLFKRRETVIIFTQYTDTMDFMRSKLRLVYGSQVACYSGRGGEVWRDGDWQPTTKEDIKNAFRKGDAVKILICTEAASEGLNLQTCGVLINYDMPWNPMRVEQRIGRVDRIGQVHDTVWVRHYFYEGTVEARVYRALEDRINWFQDVVGELQPILARVGQTIQTVAMAPGTQRAQVLAAELERLREEINARQADAFDLDRHAGDDGLASQAASPVTLPDLERLLMHAPALDGRFAAHPTLERAYLLKTEEGEEAVTFDVDLFDQHPNSLRFLTYGSDLLARLLAAVPVPASHPEGHILRCATDAPLARRAYYILDGHGRPQRIGQVNELEAAYQGTPGKPEQCWTEEAIATARASFEREVSAEAQHIAEVIAARLDAERRALAARARQVLLHAALVELAMAQQPHLFVKQALPMAFSEEAVLGLQRHGFPFAPLLKLVKASGLRPRPTDPFYAWLQGQPAESLKREFAALQSEASRLVSLLAQGVPQAQPTGTPVSAQVETMLM